MKNTYTIFGGKRTDQKLFLDFLSSRVWPINSAGKLELNKKMIFACIKFIEFIESVNQLNDKLRNEKILKQQFDIQLISQVIFISTILGISIDYSLKLKIINGSLVAKDFFYLFLTSLSLYNEEVNGTISAIISTNKSLYYPVIFEIDTTIISQPQTNIIDLSTINGPLNLTILYQMKEFIS